MEFNTINFNGFQTSEPFLLSINGSPDFKPRVIFHCGSDVVNIKKLSLGDNIISLCINAKDNQKINIGSLGDNSKSKLILRGGIVPFGSLNVGERLTVQSEGSKVEI